MKLCKVWTEGMYRAGEVAYVRLPGARAPDIGAVYVIP